jgi:hypothetical protein
MSKDIILAFLAITVSAEAFLTPITGVRNFLWGKAFAMVT